MDGAAFNPPRTFKHGTQHTTARTNGSGFEMVTAGLNGAEQVFPVERILAHSPLRQMLVSLPGGRLQATEAAWDPRSNEWFNVYGAEDRKPGEWGHWTGRGMNWNSMCARCHNTALEKNYDAITDNYRTRMVETGVGCESCHGPMQDHNDWQRANKGRETTDPTIRRLSREQMFETCGACHSRRAELTASVPPGAGFWDHHSLSIVDGSDLFYPDGQVRDEDYEFSSFLGSGMHSKGVRCVDCHDSHTMKPKLPGNFLCMNCHSGGVTNAPVINPVAHSFHRADSAGNQCVNCHMPQTTYMQRHSRHDHAFTIPDPLLTKQAGIPNACERCHADKGTDWNLKHVETWYGAKMNRPYRQRALAVAAARRGDDAAREPLLAMLTKDESPYWRAVAANLLQRWVGEPAVSSGLIGQLQNTNAMVREKVVQALAPLVDAGRAEVVPLIQARLADPSRNVRIEAARLTTATLDTNSTAGRDYLAFLNHISDQPAGQLQNGVFKWQRRDETNALAHFQTAAKWDPNSAGIRHELAIVLSSLGRAREAVEQLETAVRLAPDDAEFHYKLALALNEVGDVARVMPELERAVKCDPRHGRAWYNLGLARSGRGDDAGAEEALLRAESVETGDARIPYARATVLARLGRSTEAKIAARRALEIAPGYAEAAELLRQLERR